MLGVKVVNASILVPIKTTNERLPGKNTRNLKGKPLYWYLFRTLKTIKNITTVYVDSSDKDILKIADEWGFSTFKRPEEYNAHTITGDELIMRVVDSIDTDIIGLLHVTSPFLKTKTIENAISLFEDDHLLDSAFGVVPIYDRFWFKGAPVNHDIKELKRTQDLEPVYKETDIYFARKKSIMKYKKRICGNAKPFEVDAIEATDIDYLSDFLTAGALIDSGLTEFA